MWARLLLLALYLINGWQKITHVSATIDYMSQVGAPLPTVSAAIAIAVELLLAAVCAVGFMTRPLACLFAAYTLATTFIGHRYWTLTGAMRADNMEHFFKNISITGGFLLLYVAGPGRYALDTIFGLSSDRPEDGPRGWEPRWTPCQRISEIFDVD